MTRDASMASGAGAYALQRVNFSQLLATVGGQLRFPCAGADLPRLGMVSTCVEASVSMVYAACGLELQLRSCSTPCAFFTSTSLVCSDRHVGLPGHEKKWKWVSTIESEVEFSMADLPQVGFNKTRTSLSTMTVSSSWSFGGFGRSGIEYSS